MNTMMSLILGVLLAIGQSSSPAHSPLEMIARDALANFNAGRFDVMAKSFNEKMRASVTPAVLADLQHQASAQLGVFRNVTEVRERMDGGSRLVELICSYEKAAASFRVVFDARDRVSAIFFDPIVSSPVDPALEATAREWVRNLTARAFDVAGRRFDKNMRKVLPPPKLALLERQVTLEYGRFQSIKSVQQVTIDDYRTIEVITSYERKPLMFRVMFDQAGQIAGIKIAPAP